MTTNLPAVLPLEGGTVTQIENNFSAGLWKLLTEVDEGRSAIRLIAINPTLRAEAERMIPMLERITRPMTPEEMLLILTREMPTYGIPNKPQGEWAAFFGAYLRDLAPLNATSLVDAFTRWGRGEMYPQQPGRHGFYPKPAELTAMAKKMRTDLSNALYRAREALRWADVRPRPKTAEDRRRDTEEAIRKGFLIRGPDGTLRPNMAKPAPMVDEEEGFG